MKGTEREGEGPFSFPKVDIDIMASAPMGLPRPPSSLDVAYNPVMSDMDHLDLGLYPLESALVPHTLAEAFALPTTLASSTRAFSGKGADGDLAAAARARGPSSDGYQLFPSGSAGGGGGSGGDPGGFGPIGSGGGGGGGG